MAAYTPDYYRHKSANPRISKRKVKAILRGLLWAAAVLIKELIA